MVQKLMHTFAIFLKMFRVHHWCKNLLLFLPMLTSHTYNDGRLWILLFLSFVAFCCCASSIYIQNDLLDRAGDRLHSKKKLRPIAAGQIRPRVAVMCSACLLVVAIALACNVSREFLLVLACYFAISTMYSLVFKRMILLDLILLGSLYVIRILAGGEASGITISLWLLSFSAAFFISLAFLKRYVEYAGLENHVKNRRAYRRNDLQWLFLGGSCFALVSLVIFIFYLFSEQAKTLYSQPLALTGAAGLLLFWNVRIWVLAKQREIHFDPVVFVLKDWVSYIILILFGFTLLFAK